MSALTREELLQIARKHLGAFGVEDYPREVLAFGLEVAALQLERDAKVCDKEAAKVSFWKVVVVGWKTDGFNVPPMPVRRVIMLSSESADHAMAMAVSYAERTAEFGPKWLGFQPREAIPIELPMDMP